MKEFILTALLLFSCFANANANANLVKKIERKLGVGIVIYSHQMSSVQTMQGLKTLNKIDDVSSCAFRITLGDSKKEMDFIGYVGVAFSMSKSEMETQLLKNCSLYENITRAGTEAKEKLNVLISLDYSDPVSITMEEYVKGLEKLSKVEGVTVCSDYIRIGHKNVELGYEATIDKTEISLNYRLSSDEMGEEIKKLCEGW